MANEGIDEVGIRSDTQEVVIKIDQRYFRPTEVETLLGDPTKAKTKLGWEPKISLEEMVKEMIAFDKKESQKEALLKRKGFDVFASIENPPNNIKN